MAIGAKRLDIPIVGLREASFAFLRAGGKPLPSLPIMIAFYPDGLRVFVDGRHRVALARERGEKHVLGRLLGYGPRGGVVWCHTGRVAI